VHAVDSSGQAADDSVQVGVDTRRPGALTAPAPGDSLSGTVNWAFTPAAGFSPSQVQVSCNGAYLGVATTAGADGTFAGSGDTTGCVAGANSLTAAGANANAANRSGVTPLSLAAGNASGAMVKLLLDAGANPNATIRDGQTILMAAARTGSPEAVKLLLDRGADVNAREQTLGENALMWAAAEDHPEAVKLLVARGADVNGRTNTLAWSKDRRLEGVLTILPKGAGRR
jgi:ankyrin repeat protein